MRQAHHIRHVIKMHMRQEDMRGTCHGCLMLIFWKNRISVSRINQVFDRQFQFEMGRVLEIISCEFLLFSITLPHS